MHLDILVKTLHSLSNHVYEMFEKNSSAGSTTNDYCVVAK